MLSGGSESPDLTFYERQFQSTDARRFSCTVNLRHRSLLKLIHSHAAVVNNTSQQLRQFNIRHEMKTARQIIARYLPTLTTAEQSYAFEFVFAMRRQRPATSQISYTFQRSTELQRLGKLAVLLDHTEREPCQSRRRRLLRDQQYVSATAAQIGRHCQSQRSTAGNDNSLTFNRQSGFDERLQTSSTHHVRQSPTRKWQEALACTCSKNQILVTQL